MNGTIPCIGTVLGDMCGMLYERRGTNIFTMDFPFPDEKSRFTDDTAMTAAVMDALLLAKGDERMFGALTSESLRKWGRKYEKWGCGGRFRKWLRGEVPGDSFGNGAVMRVAPCGWIAKNVDQARRLGELSARPSHSHPDAVNAAGTMAAAVFRLLHGTPKEEVFRLSKKECGFAFPKDTDAVRKVRRFQVAAKDTLPIALTVWHESKAFENCLRLAVSLGGDADTNAAIAGALMQAELGAVPVNLQEWAISRLTDDIRETFLKFGKAVEITAS